MFFLFLFTLLQLQTFETDNGFYVLIQSQEEALTFSSYRLSNQERIVLEINGSVPSGSINSAMSVKSIKVSENAGITRFIFETKNNTHYTVLNKNNAVLIGFSSKLFLDEGNFDITLAKIKDSQKQTVKIAEKKQPQKEKKVTETTPVKKKADESKLVGNFLEDLKEKETQRQLATKKEAEEKRLAQLRKQEKLKKQEELRRHREEQKRIEEEEKRITELKRQEELKKQEIARKKAEEKRLAELKRQEELKRIELEKKEAEKRRLAELKRQEELKRIQLEKKKAEEKRLAELKRQEELKKQEIARKKAEEKRLAELKHQEELRRKEQERKESEKRRLAELKRQEELKRIQLEKKKVEEKRLAELKRQEELKKQQELEKKLAEKKRRKEEQRLAELKRLELKKKESEEKRLAALEKKEKEKKKLIKTEDGIIRNLKVTKAEGDKSLADERPDLPVKKLKKKGTLKNIYFRKYADFSRVTLEISGDTEYRFREIKGGYVIDVHNFKKIPRHLLNIIDARAFNAQVKYIYPKKVDNMLKIYIKTDKGIAVRKSEEGETINFDFFEPTLK